MASELKAKLCFLFVYEDYYPSGGADDCEAVFDSEQAALEHIKCQYLGLKRDNIELCIVRDGQLEILYYAFNVTGVSGGTQRVLGCDKTNVIKFKAREERAATPRYYYNHYPSISIYKDESV